LFLICWWRCQSWAYRHTSEQHKWKHCSRTCPSNAIDRMPKLQRVRRRDGINQVDWSFEPSFCRPAQIVDYVGPLEATDAYRKSFQSTWYDDMISKPAYATAPPVLADDDRTHNRLFGTASPAVVRRRRRDAGDCSCDVPRWSPDCQRPPSVDDFTRTHRNIHGDQLPTLKPPAPPVFNVPRTTILGPHLLPPVCCPHPGTSTSPVSNERFERSRYNVIGPQTPEPLRRPHRPDDFVNSKLNLFGPPTPVPVRFPRRLSDFDDTKRNLFGSPVPYRARRPPLRVHDNTFDHLFGKTATILMPLTTPPPALRQNIDVLSPTAVLRSHTPPRFQPRPEASFDNTYDHLFGRRTPVIPKYQYRQVLPLCYTFRIIISAQRRR